MLKNGEVLLEIEDRDGGFWRQRDDAPHTHPAGKGFILPDRIGIFEWGRDHFQHANPPRDTRQVTQQVIARLNVLHDLPAPFAEPRDFATCIKELLPGSPRE